MGRNALRFGCLALLLYAMNSASARAARAPGIEFAPAAPEFEPAAAEYRAIWADDGERIAQVFKRRTGLQLAPQPIRAIVFEGVSHSGYGSRPMRLRASLPSDTKRATLVHELAHRLIAGPMPSRFEDHPVIFLFLYDVWVDLWGQDFADAQVAVESRRRGYDYAGAWRETLALSADERARRWSEFLAQRRG